MTWKTPSRALARSLLLMAMLAACSSGKDTSATEAPAQSAAGTGAAGRSGKAAFFQRRAKPGEALPSDFSLMACAGVTQDPSATASLTDCSDICGGAHCVEAASAGGPDVILPDCTPTSGGPGKCIPDEIVETGGKFVYKPCENDGAPGVCIPDCLILDAGAVWLLQNSCNVGELCVTCDQEVCGDRCTGNYPTFRP